MMKVTVLSGFLGAGKTTLLQHILQHSSSNSSQQRTAVIVNDMAEINVDAAAVHVQQQDVEMVELHNGCICCTLRGDLLKSVKQLSLLNKFDTLVIESTGIGEPLPVAQTFTMNVDDEDDDEEEEENGEHDEKRQKTEKQSLSHYATLDTLVTVVDALNIYDVLGSIETLADGNNVTGMIGNTGAAVVNGNNNDDNDASSSTSTTRSVDNDTPYDQIQQEQPQVEPDDRPVSQLWLYQIEFANVIVVSKAPLLLKKNTTTGAQQLAEIEALLHRLNPTANIVTPHVKKSTPIWTCQAH